MFMASRKSNCNHLLIQLSDLINQIKKIYNLKSINGISTKTAERRI